MLFHPFKTKGTIAKQWRHIDLEAGTVCFEHVEHSATLPIHTCIFSHGFKTEEKRTILNPDREVTVAVLIG